MTTIAVVRKNGVAAIAADTLTKWGSVKETADFVANHEKIFRVGDSLLAVCGPASGRLALRDYFFPPRSRRAPPKLHDVDAIYRCWRGVHEALKEDYFLRPNEEEGDPFESSRVSVLIANPWGIFGVDPVRMVQQYTRYYAYGRGCEYAMGAMYAIYEQPQLDAEAIARFAVQAAAQFDDSTGLPVTSHTLRLRRQGS